MDCNGPATNALTGVSLASRPARIPGVGRSKPASPACRSRALPSGVMAACSMTMLMALPPDYLAKAIAGMEALSKNGLRYPFPQYGIQQDARAGLAVSYGSRGG